MNKFTEEIIQKLIEIEYLSIQSILLEGSKVNKTNTDFWSDTDLRIILKPNEKAIWNEL